ncbi:la-related protein 6 [Onthophagus taurus]|uniref:la-related protein 6 n=1 Tax=Onthophagus taurus TaxID=166361 RepID=UPI000C20B19C|nr:la-related protein 6 [Onthophagus taurus]
MPVIEDTVTTTETIIEENEDIPSKILETRDSISSIDSNISLSFDKPRKNSQNEAEDEGAHMGDLSDSASDTGSQGGGKDSGCEVTPEVVEEPPFQPPSDELADKIVQQVEFYFSDANISKDAFLLKHVKRNKEGYVSLKLISSFKRVKHITKDWRVVAHALARSKKLEINEPGTKLRRIDPLPQYDETTPSRTIVAVNMPIEKPTIENVAELFKECGEISLIRILRPGNPIPADVRQFINKNPSLAGLVCALVEFVVSESARNAIKLQENHEELKVYELNGVPHPERKKKNNKKTINNKKSSIEKINEEDKILDPRLKLRRGNSSHFPSRNIEPAAWLQRRFSATTAEANFLFMPRRLSYGSRDSSDSSLYTPRRLSSASTLSGFESSGSSSYNRRMSSCSQTSDSSCGRSRSNSTAFHNDNLVRLPKGPDGSKGFGRPRQIPA